MRGGNSYGMFIGSSSGRGFVPDLGRPPVFHIPLPVTTGLQLWLRGDDLGPVGGTVSTWKDRSGNGRDYTIAPGASAPSVVSGVGAYRAVQFNGINQALQGAESFADSDDFSIFMIARPNIYTSILWRGEGGSCSDGFNMAFGDYGAYLVPNDCILFQINLSEPYNTPSSDIAHNLAAFTLTRELANSGLTKFYGGQSLVAATNTIAGALRPSSTPVRLGRYSSSDYRVGCIGELIMFNRLVTAVERYAMHYYLRRVWHLR